jgi:hypothetical protein
MKSTTEVLRLVREEAITACATRESGNDIISLDSLAKMTGFPSELIKKELLISDDHLSMTDLRTTMMKFLMKSIKD